MGSIFRSIFIENKNREQRNKYITRLVHDEPKRMITKEEVYPYADNNNEHIVDLKNVTFTINKFINITSFEPKVPVHSKEYPIETIDRVYAVKNRVKFMSSVSMINKNHDKIKKS